MLCSGQATKTEPDPAGVIMGDSHLFQRRDDFADLGEGLFLPGEARLIKLIHIRRTQVREALSLETTCPDMSSTTAGVRKMGLSGGNHGRQRQRRRGLCDPPLPRTDRLTRMVLVKAAPEVLVESRSAEKESMVNRRIIPKRRLTMHRSFVQVCADDWQEK
jgi:hypothetical protein